MDNLIYNVYDYEIIYLYENHKNKAKGKLYAENYNQAVKILCKYYGEEGMLNIHVSCDNMSEYGIIEIKECEC